MKKLSAAPRTPAWHAARNEAWTASMAATLVCKENAILLQKYAADRGVTLDIAPLLAVGIESYYGNTLWKVWAEKVGRIPRFKGNAHTDRGTQNETKIVNYFESLKLMIVEPDVTAYSSDKPYLMASFDALAPSSSDPVLSAPNGFPVEAKCPAFGFRKKLWDSKKSGRLAILGLPYYWCQVQHQIYVADAPYGWFVAAGVEKNADTGEEEVVYPIVEQVPRDSCFLKAYIAAAEYYYQEFIDGCIEPPKTAEDEAMLAKLASDAVIDRAVAELDHDLVVEQYLSLVKDEADIVVRKKELEAKLITAAGKLRAEGDASVLLGSKLQVTWSCTSSTSWQKVAKDLVIVAGLKDVPSDILAAATGKPRDVVKLKEVA